MGARLAANQYGKAENRVVRVYRDTPRHEIVDLTVSTALRGDFAAAHLRGDQSAVLPTDTQKNTAFAFAKDPGIDSPEQYALALGRRLLHATPHATAAQIRVEEHAWDRVQVGGQGHDHAFVRRGGDIRTAVVTVDGRGTAEQVWVLAGLTGLTVLKSTGSQFTGFLVDEFTTLAEADDRILATSLVARWRYAGSELDWNALHAAVRQTVLETFAVTYSRALQETLYRMGEAVLDAHPDVAEIRFSAPNKHHFAVDLAPFGMRNDNEVFIAADRPYGLIEAAVIRDDVPAADEAWPAVPGFA